MSQGPKVNWWILGGGMAVLLGFVALMLYGFTQDPRELEYDVLVGKRAPALSLTDMDGNEVSLEDLRGKPVVVNFWSTWCIPCRQEHPLLQRYPAAYPEVTFLGVIYQDTAPKVKRFLERDPVPYPTLMDPGGRVSIDYGVTGVPETYFIDRDGQITHKQVGPLTEDVLVAQLERISQ